MFNNGSDFNCKKCLHKHCDEKMEWPGSKGPALFPFYSSAITDKLPWIADTKTCILPMITELTSGYFRLYRSYKVGLLPFEGALFDQPEKYLRVMDLLETYIVELKDDVRHTS